MKDEELDIHKETEKDLTKHYYDSKCYTTTLPKPIIHSTP